MTLPTTRILQPSDGEHFQDQMQTVLNEFGRESGQHPARRVEYASVLSVLDAFSAVSPIRRIVDVGGAGSPLRWMIQDRLAVKPEVVDPDEPGGVDLSSYLQRLPQLADVVTCVSVLEHVEAAGTFVRDLVTLLRPGGLLVLTMDYALEHGPDTYHFHWMRKRIYTPKLVHSLFADNLTLLDCRPWPVPVIGHPLPRPEALLLSEWGYTFCQIVVQKAV